MIKKPELALAEFYITNICNFNCSGCNRFNNYNFSGYQKWEDYKDIYTQWSKRVDIKLLSILGGEPTLNPSFLDWVEGLSKLWPESNKRITTNGSTLDKFNRNFYNLLKDTKFELFIGLHNKHRRKTVLDSINNFLGGSVNVSRDNLLDLPNIQDNFRKSYQIIKDSKWPDCASIEKWVNLPKEIKQECHEIHNFSPELLAEELCGWTFIDNNGVKIYMSNENFFHQGALIPDQIPGKIKLHNSDPKIAHNICHSKTCHHFDKGKLYKCGQVALFNEFDQQFGLDLDEEDKQLMHSYIPGTIDQSQKQLRQFVSNLPDQIDQCKFCPESYEMSEIFAEQKKAILPKKKINA